MKQYIGTKIINAKPMTRLEYNQFRGWQLPADENGDDEGFLVEYVDGGKANTSEYNGYVSWSPTGVFERAYHTSGGMTFGDAIVAMKAGKRVARAGWNGKGMYIWLMPGSVVKRHGDITEMRTADGSVLTGWLASKTDEILSRMQGFDAPSTSVSLNLSLRQSPDEMREILRRSGTDSITFGPSARMRTADGSVLTGWLASQTDMFAEDWCIVE